MENDKIILRALEPEDLPVLYRWENDTSLWCVGNTLSPYSRYILKQYIEQSGDDIYTARQLRLVIEKKESKVAIGTIDLYDFEPHHSRAGVGIIVDPLYQKCGFGKSALDLLVDYAFGYLHIHQLYAYIPVENTSSFKLFSKAGFSKSGILKDWLKFSGRFSDVLVMQKIKTSEISL